MEAIVVVLIMILYFLYQISAQLSSQHDELKKLIAKQIEAIELSSISCIAASKMSADHSDPERRLMIKEAQSKMLAVALNPMCKEEDKLSGEEVENEFKKLEKQIDELSVYSDKNREQYIDDASSIFTDIRIKISENA